MRRDGEWKGVCVCVGGGGGGGGREGGEASEGGRKGETEIDEEGLSNQAIDVRE